ncbi:MAG: hypothetical protein BMS9Abin12_1589 [Acidimicrobiia bacterium]|nr:MAG: hypothetical protein BMS9Abin12_1589 [Acidimicrobiia bacterium]
MRRIIAPGMAALIIVIAALPALATTPTPNAIFLDKFTTQSFSGNDGTYDFAGPWLEISESNGPTSGFVWVWDHSYCDGAYCLKMGGTSSEVAGHGASRAVDLGDATWAELSFDYGRQLLAGESSGEAVIQVSSNGGGNWKKLETIDLDADDGGVIIHETLDITEWATPNTVIRFKIFDADGINIYLMFDNVRIEAIFETASTTTTTGPKATTTTVPPTTTTTTTTVPPTTTTTTTKPRETTTTSAPHQKVLADTTTTTRPGETTTTTLPPTTTRPGPPSDPGRDIPAEDLDTMMNKTGIAVTAAMPPIAIPGPESRDDASSLTHAEPIAAFAAAFFTDSGNYGGNLLPSVGLGIVIAVLSLLGIRSRKRDELNG